MQLRKKKKNISICFLLKFLSCMLSLKKSASRENITITRLFKILPPKMKIFREKKSDIFHITAQYIDCGYSLEPPQRGGSNEYPQSMFLSRNKKNNVYPCKPQFYYIKVGFKGVKIIKACFRNEMSWSEQYFIYIYL